MILLAICFATAFFQGNAEIISPVKTNFDLCTAISNFQGADVSQRMENNVCLNPYKDGLPDSGQRQLANDYPLLFDSDFNPKPAFFKVIATKN